MELLGKNEDETKPILTLERAQYKKPSLMHKIKYSFQQE